MSKQKLIDTTPIIEILRKQLMDGTGFFSQFERLQKEISNVLQQEIDPNFKGTLQEIATYCKTAKESNDMNEQVRLHDLNIKRWIEELQFIMSGSVAVTIDYEQRKGREI